MRLSCSRRRSDLPTRHRGPLLAKPTVPCAALAALLLVAASSCGSREEAGPESAEPEPIHVEAVTLEPRLLVDEASLTGQLEAENEVVVQSEVEGVIRSVEFDEGERVEEGEVLFLLRDGEQVAELHVAEAGLALAKDVYDRVTELTSQDIQSRARRAEAAARLDRAKAELDLARLELARTRIRAPFAGVTGSRTVSPGQRIEPDDGLVWLSAVDRLQLVFTTQEYAAPLAHVGLPIHVRVAAWPDERFPGEVFFVSPRIDPATRRLIMKAWIQNAEGRLKPGMFANVDVEISRKEEALVLPESAVVYDRNGVYAWIVGEGEKARKVPIHIGLRQKGVVEVLDGLAPGDRVVTAGSHKLAAGDPVAVVSPAAATARSSRLAPARAGGGSGAET